MEARRVFIVGDSLFAETLARALSAGGPAAIEVVGIAPTPETALARLQSHPPDAVIIAGSAAGAPTGFEQLLHSLPDLPVIRADLRASDIQIITSRRIDARAPELIAAIAALPKRS